MRSRMPRRRRLSTAGLVFHVVNRGAKSATLFERPGDYEVFECLLRDALCREKVALFAYCLMPNHWHLLLSPQADGALSRMMHWLTTTHARRWQTFRGMDGRGAVYQGRFKASPVSADDHFLWVCRYVERNALRAALVLRAEDWPWSSLGRRENGAENGWLSNWPAPRPDEWVAHVNRPQTNAELEAFRRAVKRGQPYGNDAWCREVSTRLGIPYPRPRGRPRRQPMPAVLEK